MARQDGLAQTLRGLLLATQARRGTLDVGAPAQGPTSARGFESLSERAPIPEDVRAYVTAKTGAPPARAPASPQDVELADAQDADARSAFFSRAGQGFDDAGRVIAGLGPGRAMGGDSGARVRALSQQRESGAAAAKAAQKAALSDPNSDVSKAFRARAAKILGGIYSPEELDGLTAADEAAVLDIGKTRGTLKARAAESAASRALQEKLARERNAQSGENARTMAGFQRERLDLTKDAAEREAAKAGKGPMLPASEALGFGGIDAATQMLDELTATRKAKTGTFSGVTQYLPGTDAGEYADAQKAAAQTVGLILEGGKLAEGDLSRYMAMIPSAGDSDERAHAKVENIKRMLVLKKAATLNALKTAGFNTGNLSAEVQEGAPRGGNLDLAAKVRVSNGSETLEIDASDLAAAEADGYQRVTQ